MKLSISIVDEAGPKVPFVIRGNYLESIKLAKEIGYDAIELHVRDPKTVDVPAVKEALKNAGLEVSSIGTGLSYGIDKLTLMSDDDSVRAKAVARLKDFVALAKEFDTIIIIGLIKGIVLPDQDFAVCEGRVTKCLKEVLEVAEKMKVTIVIEAINRYESNFLVTAKDVLDFVNKFNSDYLKVHIDSFHMNIEEANFEKTIEMCGNKLGHVHFADSDRMYPGHGHIDFKSFMNKLDEVGYKGYIAIECLSLPEPELVARESYKHLKSL